MKMLRILMIAGVMALFFIAPAGATLTSNLLVNGDFTSTSITNSKISGSLSNGVWYGNATGWVWTASGGNPGAYAYLGSNSGQQFLFEAVSYTGSAGQVAVSFDYTAQGLRTATTSVNIYGSAAQPTYGSYGTLIGTIPGSGLSDQSNWTNKSTSSLNASQGYAWYTILIVGDHASGGGNPPNFFSVDNVSLQVTAVPIPAAAWLLGSGLIGLVVVRRRSKK